MDSANKSVQLFPVLMRRGREVVKQSQNESHAAAQAIVHKCACKKETQHDKKMQNRRMVKATARKTSRGEGKQAMSHLTRVRDPRGPSFAPDRKRYKKLKGAQHSPSEG